ncbi:MAG: hypothetical protein E6J91_35955 [Deltaproteobacteria bacterium]|nr:MAG: hypothetical protein E6J91_35955 [Deltaproteobacteria bacterium]
MTDPSVNPGAVPWLVQYTTPAATAIPAGSVRVGPVHAAVVGRDPGGAELPGRERDGIAARLGDLDDGPTVQRGPVHVGLIDRDPERVVLVIGEDLRRAVTGEPDDLAAEVVGPEHAGAVAADVDRIALRRGDGRDRLAVGRRVAGRAGGARAAAGTQRGSRARQAMERGHAITSRPRTVPLPALIQHGGLVVAEEVMASIALAV